MDIYFKMMKKFFFIIFLLFLHSECIYLKFVDETKENCGPNPMGIAVDKDLDCTIFVPNGNDNGNYLVYKFNKDLKNQERIEVPTQIDPIFNGYDTVYGSFVYKNMLFFGYLNEGKLYGMFTENGTVFDPYYGSYVQGDDDICCKAILLGLVVDNGNLYASYSYSEVIKYTLNGKRLSNIGEQGYNEGQFQQPFGLAIDDKGYLYVTDSYDSPNIQKFTLEGDFVKRFGIGKFAEYPEGPPDVAVDNKGFIYVTDKGNNRILVFTENGEYVYKFKKRTMRKPHGIVYCNGILYVTVKGAKVMSFEIHYGVSATLLVSVCGILVGLFIGFLLFIVFAMVKIKKKAKVITDQSENYIIDDDNKKLSTAPNKETDNKELSTVPNNETNDNKELPTAPNNNETDDIKKGFNFKDSNQSEKSTRDDDKDEISNLPICCVCMDNRCNVVLLPCGHAKFCAKCATELFSKDKNCPICRVKIQGVTKIYL